MSILRTAVAAGLLCSSVSFAVDIDLTAPAILDDFNDRYGDVANQNSLGAVYGVYSFGNKPWLGGGYWYIFADKEGSEVLNSAGEVVVASSSEVTMVADSALHVKLNTSGSTNKYPYSGVGCNLVGSDKAAELKALDLSKMTAITMKVKGTGTVRMHFETKDFIDAAYDWGYYGAEIELTSSWKTVTITTADLVPEPWSPAAIATPPKTWADGKVAVYKLAFKVKDLADAEIFIDDITFVGMKYEDFNFTPTAHVLHSKTAKNANAFSVNASTISFNLPQAQDLTVSIHDALGNKVRDVFTGKAASKTINWNSKNLSSGRYMVVLTGKNVNYSESLAIVK